MKQLFTSIVRPHLEYANVVWHPYLKKDIELLESVQQQAKKNPKAFYRYVNSKLKTRTGVGNLRTKDGDELVNSSEKADMMEVGDPFQQFPCYSITSQF